LAKNVANGNFAHIKELGSDLYAILDAMEQDEENLNNIKLGRFFEIPLALGAFLRTPYACELFGEDCILLDPGTSRAYKGTPIISLFDIKNSAQGPIDILINSKTKIYPITVKYRDIPLHATQFEAMLVFIDKEKIGENKEICAMCLTKNPKRLENLVKRKQDARKINLSVIGPQEAARMWKECYEYFEQYNFDVNKIDKFLRKKLKTPLHLKPHQKISVENAIRNYEHSDRFLLAHKPRSGKSIVAAEIGEKLNAENILLLTAVPVLNRQWEKDVYNKYFPERRVINTSKNTSKPIHLPNEKYILMVSIQDIGDFDKEKFDKIRDIEFDFIIFDEVHYGVETARTHNFLKQLKYKKMIGLTATPRKNMDYGRFIKKEIDFYGIQDELENKKKYPEIYGDCPEQDYRIFEIPQLFADEIAEYSSDEKDNLFTWVKFLK